MSRKIERLKTIYKKITFIENIVSKNGAIINSL
jgi:hypothetical protein